MEYEYTDYHDDHGGGSQVCGTRRGRGHNGCVFHRPGNINYESKRRNIWIRDVFCYRILAPLVPWVPGGGARLDSVIKEV